MTAPKLSIVVIGRNEGSRLERCLRSVRQMRDPGCLFEIIYVDSASTDSSVHLAQLLHARTIVIRTDHPTAALARNTGWRAARGEFILFLDGDTVLHPDFVVDSLPEFGARRVAVIWGHRRELKPRDSIFNRVLDLDWIYPHGLSEFCGGDALFRRSVLVALAGFDASLIAGEEPELCSRIRLRGDEILHVDCPMTGHDLAITHLSQYIKRAVRAGYAYAQVSHRFAGAPVRFWSREARANQIRAALLCSTFLIAMTSGFAFRSLVPPFLLAGLFSLLVLRSAWKSRWKTSHAPTLLLHGIHSHLQQLPIFWGQIRYWRDRRVGKSRGLIEYKGATS